MSSMEADLDEQSTNKSDAERYLLKANNLKKWFNLRTGIISYLTGLKPIYVQAVDNITLKVRFGEIYGLVGESGCGKTTLGQLLIRLLEPDDGSIYFENRDITHLKRNQMKSLRRNIQIIFQDPFSSLPVRLTVKEILEEPLLLHTNEFSNEEKISIIKNVLEATDLVPINNFMDKHPNELSGGQRQRVNIARAIMLKPKLIIADEPVSMLDVSVRAGILELLKNLKKDYGFTIILITHDLSVAQYMCDKIGVMYIGKLVEEGPGKIIFKNPYHPYSQLLKSVLPTLNPNTKHHLNEIPVVEGEISSPINPPSGCRFHPRCPFSKDICKKEEPILKKINERRVACHGINNWIMVN